MQNRYFCCVKKACAYLVFFILFLNDTSFQQLLKFPFLVEHFVEHHQRDKRVGLLDFFYMHYWGKDINDDDEDKDMRLPFKKFDYSSVPQLFFPVAKTPTIRKAVCFYKVDFPKMNDPFLPNPEPSTLFRPPMG